VYEYPDRCPLHRQSWDDFVIRVAIFDLGGVLFSDGTNHFINLLERDFGVSPGLAREVINGSIGRQYREGKVSRESFWYQTKSLLGLDEPVTNLERLWIDSYEINEEVRDLISSLQPTCTVLYLSNNVRERVAALDKLHQFLSLFDGGIFSYAVGHSKPEAAIYRLIMECAELRLCDRPNKWECKRSSSAIPRLCGMILADLVFCSSSLCSRHSHLPEPKLLAFADSNRAFGMRPNTGPWSAYWACRTRAQSAPAGIGSSRCGTRPILWQPTTHGRDASPWLSKPWKRRSSSEHVYERR